jgi:hypothetical protein
MSPQSGIGLGSTIDDLLDAILRRLDSMEEKLQPLGRHLAGVGDDGDGALHAVGGGVDLSVGDLPDDDSTDILLGNCTTVVLANETTLAA